MDDRLSELRAGTRERIQTLQAQIDELMGAATDSNGDDEHDPEGATIAFEREQLNAMLQAARCRLADVDAALARVEGGIYGRCLSCSRAIDDERLDARPTATTCRECAGRRR